MTHAPGKFLAPALAVLIGAAVAPALVQNGAADPKVKEAAKLATLASSGRSRCT